jgi:hypothetical protein
MFKQQDILLSCYNYFDEELNEIEELEAMLKNTKMFHFLDSGNLDLNSENNITDIIKRADSLETLPKPSTIMSEGEDNDGYKSGGSCFSDPIHSPISSLNRNIKLSRPGDIKGEKSDKKKLLSIKKSTNLLMNTVKVDLSHDGSSLNLNRKKIDLNNVYSNKKVK